MMMEDVFDKAIKAYGIKNQSIVAIEELSELQKELCKALRGRSNKAAMTEEIADVYIMLGQVERMYGIKAKDVLKVIREKRKRLERRLSDNVVLALCCAERKCYYNQHGICECDNADANPKQGKECKWYSED